MLRPKHDHLAMRARNLDLKTLMTQAGRVGYVCACLTIAVPPNSQADETRSLAGTWRLRLDSADEGQAQSWFAKPLPREATIRLPTTTDLAGYGHELDTRTMRYPVDFPYTLFPAGKDPGRADERGFLVRSRFFLGPVWYEREIAIPESWRGRVIRVRFERALWQTDLWIDGRSVGTAQSLVAPHEHILGRLDPGRHRLTVRVDNRMILNISTITHAYGPETQSRWNGLLGRLELLAAPPVALRRLEVHPAHDRRSVRAVAVIDNGLGRPVSGRLRLHLEGEGSRAALARAERTVVVAADGARPELVLELERPARAWDEFAPVRYRLIAAWVPEGGWPTSLETWFGFRQVERVDRSIRVNGRPVFLRGTLDCCVFPRTGHPPMTVPEWERIFRVIKEHGFNHVRFHTWCPPEAAFEAGDRLGLYLAPETAAWVDDWTRRTASQPPAIGRDPAINAFVQDEIRRVLETYGNHPSFLLFGIGNEFGLEGTDWEAVHGWVAEAKARDPRRLYTGAAARRNLAADDFWLTHDAHGIATRGLGPAHTDWDFSAAAQASAVPIIAHETGQRPVFPDYDDLLPKFTGPLQPWNYVRLRDRLTAQGLADQVKAFERASAQFQFVQYKAEHEAMRRTADYAGYQLLMLNDFTGQSEALVGVLDPFYESKGVVAAPAVRAWNDATVPLARFPSYTWSTTDTFRATLDVAHHGPTELERALVRWEMVTETGRVLGRGAFPGLRAPTGAVTRAGEIEVPLGELQNATTLTLRWQVGRATNAWRVWAYPAGPPALAPTQVVVASAFDEPAERALAAGRTVVFLAHGTRGPHAARTGFSSVYWSAGWWGNAFSGLGIVCDPAHPALAQFPNRGHSDWQWRDLTEGATTFRLEGAPPGYRPIVQLVPDFHYNQRLAHVFEARVGPGRLLVCGYDLTTDLDRRHAARQFRRSLLAYAGSTPTHPPRELTVEYLRALFAAAK
ncbi:MAG: hypothetical protein FJ387_06595 [Verrucomicrobia bacterium]|nr:hypothetical protein [Verrucomicrobiota bacterium]